MLQYILYMKLRMHLRPTGAQARTNHNNLRYKANFSNLQPCKDITFETALDVVCYAEISVVGRAAAWI